MRKFLLAAALAGTTIAGMACAQTAPEAPRAAGGGMARADGDGDGRVSRAEFIARADERFAGLDKNGDGQLSPDEMPQRRDKATPAGSDTPTANGRGGGMREKMRGRMIDRLDTNHDGMISRDEFRAQAAERFDRADVNRDGFLDQNEMAAMRERARSMMQRGGGNPPPPQQNPGQ
ncbi:hypothetical protein BH10PSE14_BH10PSE14_37510 [soil metagenome]